MKPISANKIGKGKFVLNKDLLYLTNIQALIERHFLITNDDPITDFYWLTSPKSFRIITAYSELFPPTKGEETPEYTLDFVYEADNNFQHKIKVKRK